MFTEIDAYLCRFLVDSILFICLNSTALVAAVFISPLELSQMFRVMDFVLLSLFVGFVIPAGLPWTIQTIHEQLDPKGFAYEAKLLQNQAKTAAARQRYISMYLSHGPEAANAMDSNESPETGSADGDAVP